MWSSMITWVSPVRAWCVLILNLSSRLRTNQQKALLRAFAPLRFNNNLCDSVPSVRDMFLVKSEDNTPHYIIRPRIITNYATNHAKITELGGDRNATNYC